MSTTIRRSEPILVAGAGGFIGGWLVRHLQEEGFANLRAVDLKPLDEWYQVTPGVDNRAADLRSLDACRGAWTVWRTSTTSPPTWAAWASSRPTRRCACSRC